MANSLSGPKTFRNNHGASVVLAPHNQEAKQMNQQNQTDLYPHFDRMQKAIMAPCSQTTRTEFEAMPVEEQRGYYQWLRRQCGELADLI